MDASSWYLVASAVGALSTANAYRPLSRRGPFAILSYFSGWPTSELPLHVLALQVVLTVAVLPFGVLDRTAGVLGLALSVASWAALVLLHARAGRAEALYEAALVDALGADYAQRVVHPRPAASGRRAGVAQMLRVRTRHVHEKDLSYGDAGSANLLDIWRPHDLKPGDRAPVLIQVPGGAWVLGKKTGQAYPLLSHLVEQGWVCVCINYRLAPKNLWPAHIIDVKKAIAWVRDNIEEYGGDPGFIALTGGSAGGHLTALAALTWDNPAYQPGFEQADTRVQAAMPFYGVFDWSDEVDTGGKIFLPHLQRTVMKVKWADDPAPFAMASPLRQIRPDAPPFLVSVGTNDTMVSPRQSRYFAPRLRAVSEQPVAFCELPDAQHTFDIFSSPRAQAAAHASGRFLGVVYGEHRARR
ncbi:MAG: esterase [Frankiales bacterium]|nr:esterase [Frankiales bacterium]